MQDATVTPEVGKDAPRNLKPANENPWYILMTLYGEQDGDSTNRDLHEKNRKAWNAWSGQVLNDEERSAAAKSSRIDKAELAAWPEMEAEVRAQFRIACSERYPDVATIPDLPNPTHEIEMWDTSFSNPVVLEKLVFTQHAFFGDATFKWGASFHSSTFMQVAMFFSATFSQDSRFDFVRFTQHADFDSAKFTAASFHSATFMQDARFNSATFTHDTWFNSVTFKRAAGFNSTKFALSARFRSATFEGFADFPEAKFGVQKRKTCAADFTDCQFAKPTNFRGAVFRDQYPILAGAVLHDKTSFTSEEDLWPASQEQLTEKEAKAARESCAVIRHALAKQGLPEDEHFFFRREMQFARQIGTFPQQLPYHLFGIFSEYGHSIKRPLWWLFGLWAFGFAAFWGYLSSCCVPKPLSAIETSMGTAFGLSLSNLFPVFGFGRSFGLNDILTAMPPALQAYAGFQTVMALPLLFFLGLALRQRFRLR